MDRLSQLRAREEECEREWLWLVETLHAIAAARAENADAQAFRLMQHQAVAVGQRRVELSLRRAELERAATDRGPDVSAGCF